MAILAKCNEALQVLQFMAHDGCTVYAVGAVMYLQIVRFSAHAASVSVADADFALYFFPIGIMLQALPISARPALDVCCSCHSIPPFCVCFFFGQYGVPFPYNIGERHWSCFYLCL